MGVYIYYVIFYELIHQQCLWLFHSLREESYFLWLIHAGTESFNLFKNNSQLLLLGSMPYTWRLWSRYLLIVQKEQYWNLNRGRKTIELDLEAEFSSLALDIIGLGVFNYDFGSVTKESPVIKVCPSILLWCCIHWTLHVNKLLSSFLTEGSFMLKHICISYTH